MSLEKLYNQIPTDVLEFHEELNLITGAKFWLIAGFISEIYPKTKELRLEVATRTNSNYLGKYRGVRISLF